MQCLTLNITPYGAGGVLRGHQGDLGPEGDGGAPGVEVGRLAEGLPVEAAALGRRHHGPHVAPAHAARTL